MPLFDPNPDDLTTDFRLDPQVFTWLSENPDGTPEEALKALGLEMLSRGELKDIVEAKISVNTDMVERMGDRALGPLMGMVMGEVRGRARAEDVQSLLREALARLTRH